MSDEDAGAAEQAPALARIVAGRAMTKVDPTFWTRESRAPADLVARLETAAGRQIVLTGPARVAWTEDLHLAYARLFVPRRQKKAESREPSEGERLQAAVAGANALVGDLLGLLSFRDMDLQRTAYEATRALIAFRMAAEMAHPALARPGTKPKTLRQHLVAELLELYRRGFGVEPRRSRGGPVTRFIGTMFAAAGAEYLSDDRIYNLIGQAQRLPLRKG